jgi:hypothetical protein
LSAPVCIVGAKTDKPCGREATARVGLCDFCERHRTVPGISPETNAAEEAVFHLRSYGRSAMNVGNDLLIECVKLALAEAEEARKEAYESVEVERPVPLPG